jgi:hypothetical protein
VQIFNPHDSTGFDLLPSRLVSGSGTIPVNALGGTGYLFDQMGNPIPAAISIGTGITTSDLTPFLLGPAFFPLDVANPIFPLDIYAAHLELNLPNAPQFAVVAAELRIAPGAFHPSLNTFVIGNLPRERQQRGHVRRHSLAAACFAHGLKRHLRS